MKQDRTVKSQITQLLLVIGAGVIGGLGLTGLLLYNYGPTGSYMAANTLLTPEIIQKISYDDSTLGKQRASRYVFDQIAFTYLSLETNQWKKINLSLDQYAKLYQLLMNDKSLLNYSESIPPEFSRNQSAILTVTAKSENNPNSPSQILEEIQFLPNHSHYRIQVRGSHENSLNWAYFEHPGIYQKIMKNLGLQ